MFWTIQFQMFGGQERACIKADQEIYLSAETLYRGRRDLKISTEITMKIFRKNVLVTDAGRAEELGLVHSSVHIKNVGDINWMLRLFRAVERLDDAFPSSLLPELSLLCKGDAHITEARARIEKRRTGFLEVSTLKCN